jgi:glycine/D-amino acid oxidase-like deaminating enzyme
MNKLPFINEVQTLLNRTCLLKKLIVLVLMGFGTFSFNPFEAQIDTGNMMQKLLKQAVSNDILILNQQTVTSFVDKGVAVEVVLNDFSFRSKKVLFATNGFANTLTGVAVKPARAQVLITEPIENLDIKELSFGSGLLLF